MNQQPTASPPLSQSSVLPRLAALLMLSAVAAPWGTTACGAQSGEKHSTDTGNPPVIDENKVQVMAAADGVRVVGRPGAVEPGGQTVEVVNDTQDLRATTTSAEDGSFSVELAGDIADDYRVVVAGVEQRLQSAGPDEETPDQAETASDVPSQCVDAAEAAGETVGVGQTRGPEPLCTDIYAEAACRAAELVTTADLSCEEDDDCIEVPTSPSCNDSCGGGAVVSSQGAETIALGLETIDAELCATFDDNECTYLASGCPGSLASEPVCAGGECSRLTGCALGSRRARESVEAARAGLAEGCQSNADCSTAAPGPCPWDCGMRPFAVAASKESEYQSLLAGLDELCQTGEQCEILGCDPIAFPDTARCNAGVCEVAELLPPLPAGCGEAQAGCEVGALVDSGYCGDPGEPCIELASLSEGCIGSHTEQTCRACGGAVEFILVGGDDAAHLYFDVNGGLAAVQLLEGSGECGDWYGRDLSDCVPEGEEQRVLCR